MVTVTWSGPESDAVAVVLPGGSGYTARSPLLHWTTAALVEQGWRVGAVEWTITAVERSRPQEFVSKIAEATFAEAPTSVARLVIGKSFGCHALPWAIERGLPGAWLTPVVTDEPIRAALAIAGPEHLAMGGDRDHMWTPDAVGQTSATLITVANADHAIESDEGWRASVEMQIPVLERVIAHAGARLATSRRVR
ncbi:hypothetical protein ACF049_16565 [Cellulosimicrobium funkei]|uniref:hypothetical protein n=1 Tax=Cellulosimicrobium TaxID=157920 RepID=UPI0036FC8675